MTHGQVLPLKCPAIAAEVNIVSVTTVFNMALGRRVPSHKATSRGTYDNIGMPVMAPYLSSTAEADYMSARGMVALHRQRVADIMSILKHIHVEVHQESGGRAFELVRMITKILK